MVVYTGIHGNVKMHRSINDWKTKSAMVTIKTKFDNDETENLTKYFRHYCESGRMEEAVFKDRIHHLLGISSDVILERIFRVFDYEGNGSVSLEEWLEVLSTILKGNLKELVHFKSRSYYNQQDLIFDLKQDGFISKSDITYLLKDSLVQVEDNEDPEEEIKNLAKITIKNMDCDQDGRLSFEDISRAVSLDIPLLEAFGHCLPHADIDLNSIIDFNH